MRSPSTATLLFACALSVWLSGCIVGPRRPNTSYEANNQVLGLNQVVIFQDSTGALSYHSPTGKDVRIKLAPRVRGEACQHGIQIPIPDAAPSTLSLSAGWGQGAYKEALEEARKGLPKDAVLFDVRADLNNLSILTVYRRLCLLVNAGVAVPVAAVAPVAPPAPPPPGPVVLEPAPSAPPAEPPPEPPAPVDPAATAVPPPTVPLAPPPPPVP